MVGGRDPRRVLSLGQGSLRGDPPHSFSSGPQEPWAADSDDSDDRMTTISHVYVLPAPFTDFTSLIPATGLEGGV